MRQSLFLSLPPSSSSYVVRQECLTPLTTSQKTEELAAAHVASAPRRRRKVDAMERTLRPYGPITSEPEPRPSHVLHAPPGNPNALTSDCLDSPYGRRSLLKLALMYHAGAPGCVNMSKGICKSCSNALVEPGTQRLAVFILGPEPEIHCGL